MNNDLSFSPFNESSREEMLRSCPEGCDKDELSDILESLSYMRDEVSEIATALLEDALLVRIYDGERYVFISPIGLTDGWNIRVALEKISEYSVREMIPLVFTDVPRDSISVYSELFRFADARVYDDDDDLFFVIVDNECSLLRSVPSVTDGELSLCEIDELDLPQYARLCRDREVNRYWGYDVAEDNTLDADEYFLDVARGEFNTGIAITLGSYFRGVFIGEAVLYNFDYRGGASVALRLLPEYQGQGLGQRTFRALLSVAKNIGLLTVFTEVREENLPSIGMTSHFMQIVSRQDGKVYFEKKL